MALEYFYITNNQSVALACERAGVDRIFVDMEYIGKDKRQKGLDTVKNHHTVQDVKNIMAVIKKSKLISIVFRSSRNCFFFFRIKYLFYIKYQL